MTAYDPKTLYNTLKELELFSETKLNKLYEKSVKEKLAFDQLLVDNDLIEDAKLGRIVADILGIPMTLLSQETISSDILRIIPEVVARKHKLISYKRNKQGLFVATTNPNNKKLFDLIIKKTGDKLNVSYATSRAINETLALYSKNVGAAFEDLIGKTHKSPAKGAFIIQIVDTIFSYAYQNKASDIHLDPHDTYSIVRFRIDGILHDIVKLPHDVYGQVVTRIKVLSRLRTDEHQSAQDGKLQYVLEEENLDIRVSIVPITEGEKVVMRLLSSRSRQFSLRDLGFSQDDLTRLERAYQMPNGMVLATGPTGSGKTTTLYSILKLINKRDVNIMTIEDPVEYDMVGVNQIQVHTATNLTFAEGLRSIVRQDPDVILVGEIRDEETASIGVNSAMTGHLVFSTLHTNDAATTFPRLLDMKVESFLVASTINIIIAQRLVRKICMKCRTSFEEKLSNYMPNISSSTMTKHFGDNEIARVYRGVGCDICHHTGYLSRIGVFETLEVTDPIRKLIVDRADANTIKQAAIKQGMITMEDDGLEKVKQGLTTFEEVIRVTKE